MTRRMFREIRFVLAEYGNGNASAADLRFVVLQAAKIMSMVDERANQELYITLGVKLCC